MLFNRYKHSEPPPSVFGQNSYYAWRSMHLSR
ncbi:hypothetical protein P3T43_000615 [Paraburkholderia sp. GAS41]|jgi:hypothetical protein